MSFNVRLNSLRQHSSFEQRSSDKLFIKLEGKTIWPLDAKFHVAHDNLLSIDVVLNTEVNKWMTVELWEYDHILPSRCIGVFKFWVDQRVGIYSADIIRKHRRFFGYTLTWQLIAKKMMVTTS